MSKIKVRLRKFAGGLALAGVLALTAGSALAGEWEVRMPVQKTARIAPQEQPPATEATPAPSGAPSSVPAAKAAPKTALARAAEAAAVAAIPAKSTTVPAPEKAPATPPAAATAVSPAVKHAAGVSTPAPAAAAAPAQPAKAAPKAAAKKSAKAAHNLSADPDALEGADAPAHPGVTAPIASAAPAAPVSAPAPKAAPGLDPKAALLPPAKTTAPTPLALPTDGKWVGDVDVEFQENTIVLHLATNVAVERVTWFNLAEAKGPRKLAVDLRGPWRKKGASVLRWEVGPVKNVVVGEHEDRLRIALEFREGAVTRELEPVLVRGENTVRLTIPLAVRLAP